MNDNMIDDEGKKNEMKSAGFKFLESQTIEGVPYLVFVSQQAVRILRLRSGKQTLPEFNLDLSLEILRTVNIALTGHYCVGDDGGLKRLKKARDIKEWELIQTPPFDEAWEVRVILFKDGGIEFHGHSIMERCIRSLRCLPDTEFVLNESGYYELRRWE